MKDPTTGCVDNQSCPVFHPAPRSAEQIRLDAGWDKHNAERVARDAAAKDAAVAQADVLLAQVGLPTYSQLVATVESMVAEQSTPAPWKVWNGNQVINEAEGQVCVCETKGDAALIVSLRSVHDILLGLVKDATAALERHILPDSTVSAADTINELLGVLDDSKTVAELRQFGVAL